MTESKSEIDSIFVTTNGTGNTTVNQDDTTSVPSTITGTSAAPSNSADVTTPTVQAPQVITEANSIQLNGTNGPSLQKVVLEDIKLEDYYNETMEESLCKQFKFQITHNELKVMIENSVLETNTAKPYRYLTGNFIRVFERHVEVFEKQRIPIQKRNNVVYEESLRNNTVYMRVNGDCKLCPKANRVRYVFIIKQKPEPDEKYVEVEAKIRGTHQHDSNLSNISLDGLTSTPTTTSATNTSIATSTTGSSSQTTTPKSSHHSTARKHTSRLSLSVLNANSSSAGGNTISANSSDPNGETNVEKVAGSNAKRPRLNHKTETIQLDSSQINSVGSNFISTSPKSTVTANSVNAATVANSQFVATSAALNLLDKNVINQIANQISSKIMIKLDQINLKVNQISDRLYDLERKLDSVEVAEIQF